MIIVDRALERREREGRPLRVAMIGAGFMGRGIALQIIRSTPGMELVAVTNRTLGAARRAFEEAGVEDIHVADSPATLRRCLDRGVPVVSEDALMVCEAPDIDVVVEVTGHVEFGARVAMATIAAGHHFVSLNAELDGTVGPIIKSHADAAGVVYTIADGDQPGVTMNLHRFVTGIGVRPVLCGNIKGLHDPYRTPTTQAAFAARWGQKPSMVTSFADGSKISYEQAIVANATGMRVGRRGMYGPTVEPGSHVDDAAEWFPHGDMLEGPGIVDYVVGAAPGPGVFVLGTHDDPRQQHYLNLYKLGEGPFYSFYTPYHLCHFEVPTTVARAALFGDPALAPIGGPVVEVVATAKTDLRAGETLDGIGEYRTYGLAENADVASDEDLLPLGLAEGCRLVADVAKDSVLRYSDVELPGGRLSDRLREEQQSRFGGRRTTALPRP